MNLENLRKRLDKLEASLQPEEPPSITCYWGDEPIPNTPGTLIIKTQWGTNTLDTEDDDDER